MWRCHNCETLNEGELCAVCGEKKPPEKKNNKQVEVEIDEIFKSGRVVTRSGLIFDFGEKKPEGFAVVDNHVSLTKEPEMEKTEETKSGGMMDFFRKADDLF